MDLKILLYFTPLVVPPPMVQATVQAWSEADIIFKPMRRGHIAGSVEMFGIRDWIGFRWLGTALYAGQLQSEALVEC